MLLGSGLLQRIHSIGFGILALLSSLTVTRAR